MRRLSIQSSRTDWHKAPRTKRCLDNSVCDPVSYQNETAGEPPRGQALFQPRQNWTPKFESLGENRCSQVPNGPGVDMLATFEADSLARLQETSQVSGP